MSEINRLIIDCIHNKNIQLSKELEKLNCIIELCETNFPNVNFNPNVGVLQLTGGGITKGTLVVDGNRVFVDVQEVDNSEDIFTLYLNVMNSMREIFAIDVFYRVGVRSFFTEEAKDSQFIDNLILDKYLRVDTEQLKSYGENPEGFHFGFTTTFKDIYKINHNFGKLIAQNVKLENGKLSSEQKFFVLYDVDFYKESLTEGNSLNEIFREAMEKFKLTSCEYFSKLGGE